MLPINSRHGFGLSGKVDLLAGGIPNGLSVTIYSHARRNFGRIDGAVFLFARQDKNVSRTTFDELRFETAHLGSIIGTVLAVSMEEQTAVTGAISARAQGALAPFVFHY